MHEFLAGAVEEARQNAARHHHKEPLRSNRVTARRAGPPPLTSVVSTCLRAVGYDAATRKLYVQFRHGIKVYTFYRVPVEVYGALMGAPSKGRYYHRHIKNKYTHP